MILKFFFWKASDYICNIHVIPCLQSGQECSEFPKNMWVDSLCNLQPFKFLWIAGVFLSLVLQLKGNYTGG